MPLIFCTVGTIRKGQTDLHKIRLPLVNIQIKILEIGKSKRYNYKKMSKKKAVQVLPALTRHTSTFLYNADVLSEYIIAEKLEKVNVLDKE